MNKLNELLAKYGKEIKESSDRAGSPRDPMWKCTLSDPESGLSATSTAKKVKAARNDAAAILLGPLTAYMEQHGVAGTQGGGSIQFLNKRLSSYGVRHMEFKFARCGQNIITGIHASHPFMDTPISIPCDSKKGGKDALAAALLDSDLGWAVAAGSVDAKTKPLPKYNVLKSFGELGPGPYGIDLEWNPNNVKTGVVVIQIASAVGVFIKPFKKASDVADIARMLRDESVKKYTFAPNDQKVIKSRMGCDIANFVDMQSFLYEQGYASTISLKHAVGIVCGVCLTKDRGTTMSFTSLHLTAEQLKYAGDDAVATLLLGQKLF